MTKFYIYTLASALALFGCQKPKNYATVSGTITNANSDSLVFSNATGYSKTVSVDSNGNFSDTLNITEGRYRFFDGTEMGTIYLKNGNSTSFTLDASTFDESLKFDGDDADKSNVLTEYVMLQENILTADLFDKEESEFQDAFSELESGFEALKSKYSSIDTAYFSSDNDDFQKMKSAYERFYNERLALKKELAKGTPSPTFSNYENFKGGTSSLKDFKGQYVYIDVWATWCGPCKAEIPALKELEHQYRDRNITFISISVDDARRSGTMEKAHTAWKTMVAEKTLSGVQLFTGKGWDTDFIKNYKINGIPRFILIDPDGNIIDPDAPRPSSSRIVEIFEELGV